MEPDNPVLDDYVLALTGKDRPKVCFVPTASGDAPDYISKFEDVLSDRAETAVLRLFTREHSDLRSFVLTQDVIYVGGGSTANLLAVWRTHGLPEVFAEAADNGTVLAGISAGMNCWFEASVTDSFGPGLAPLADGLGFLPFSNGVHHDSPRRLRAPYRRMIARGELAAGYATEDGVGLHYVGSELAEAVTVRPAARAWHLRPNGHGGCAEQPVETRVL